MLFAGGNGLSPRSITSGSFSAQPAKYSNVRCATGHVGEHRLLDRAAAVARLDLGDLAGAAAVISSATLRSFSARSLPDIFGHGPLSKAFARGFDRSLRVFAAGLGDVGDLLARRRCERRERLARLGRRSTHR